MKLKKKAKKKPTRTEKTLKHTSFPQAVGEKGLFPFFKVVTLARLSHADTKMCSVLGFLTKTKKKGLSLQTTTTKLPSGTSGVSPFLSACSRCPVGCFCFIFFSTGRTLLPHTNFDFFGDESSLRFLFRFFFFRFLGLFLCTRIGCPGNGGPPERTRLSER